MREIRKHQSALTCAQRAWGNAALDTRHELRARGVHGPLRRLDERARGARGGSVAHMLFHDALDEARHGLPIDVALAKTAQVVEYTVKLAYEEAARERAYEGPKSA